MDVALSLTPSSSSVEIDYESLPNTQKVWVHMTAGAMAGAAEHCLMFPVDSVKTRLQSLCPCPETKCPTPMHGVASMMKREGWLRPLRGVNAVAAGALPAHALYFSVYEKSKHMLTGGTTGYGNALSYGLAGCFATVVHDAVMNPAEVVKQRMQMTFSPYTGSVECIRCVYKREGIAAFYRSYATQLVMNIPFQSIHFMCYEFCQHLFNPDHKYDPKSHLCSGAIAGGIAAAVTTPLDVVKTVLNTQQTPEIGGGNSQFGRIFLKASAYRGLSDAVCSIYASRGLQGFMRGMQARVFFQTPATAISWTVYELFKFALLPSSDATS